MLSIIKKQLQHASKSKNVNNNLLKLLSKPMNEIKINFPVEINNKIENKEIFQYNKGKEKTD